ncbi:phytoene desaturase family protein [Virgisporangium aurantiacum]|uniref:4,4'-diaponeurosporene oxygenase n=1 Tax=Virgisporangium aurantiacum TaxID=175570 RepID=A0A8J4E783_9ACTN|nr:phytoene desaturase family protein [Virgisporangium aurantiacum]GIJ61572.1 phytoene desaturase [Virgisporangium aurantiacum]
MTNVVIIGAGVGGLATAVRLAAAGHTVTVFEQADEVGGKLGRLVVPTGSGEFRFDTGPSLVTLPHVFADVLPDLDLVELDPIVRHRFPDGSELDSCRDPDEFATRIGALAGPDAADDWRRLWRRAARVWDTSWRHILTRPLTSPLDVGRLAWRLRDLAAVAPGRTLRGLGRSTLRDHRLRMLLDRYATYAGADPRRAPAALVAIPYAELHFGGWYVPGGLARIADALLAAAQSRGVAVRLRTAVARIETAGGRACGVTLADGTRVPADVVVANADAEHVYRDLLPTPARLAKLADRSLAGFVVLLGLRGTSDAAHHTVYFPADYDAEFDAVFGGRIPADPTVFVTAAADDAVRPPGHEGWFVLVNAAPQGAVDWTVPGRADAYADRILDLLAERGADVRDRVLFRAVRTPADLRDRAGAPGGTIYGTAAHGLTGLLRPANRGPVRGLFLVGGSVHPGGGLPMVLLSSAIVAAQIG